MELLNATGMQAGYTLGMKPDGRESILVAIKGTFEIPQNGGQPRLAEVQEKLVEADVFSGEPGFSAPIYESDYAPVKPHCDVILNGSAYTPGDRPAVRVQVALQIGPIAKSFAVIGNRVWQKGLLGFKASDPQPFVTMPISYNNAFGGVDNTHENPAKHKAVLANPVGVGFHENLKTEFVEGKPLPNSEELDREVTKPNGNYKPMAFGVIGRAWEPRPAYAGSYDQNWIDNHFPFLPPDFNEAYFQAAPLDQQMPFPKGGERIILTNLTPVGRTVFTLPRDLSIPVTFYLKNYEEKETTAVVDTIVIEPEAKRFMLTWRASLPLRKNIFEIAQAVAGRMPKGWHRARQLGKAYYASLDEMVQIKRTDLEEEVE